MKKYFSNFLDLIFPRPCLGCGTSLLSQENQICISCLVNLPKNNLMEGNETDKRFWGKLPVQHSFSFLLYNRKGLVQKLIHQLKYRNQPDLGVLLGKLFGEDLKTLDFKPKIDVLVAVPLHPSKLQQRGYNQAACVANGLSESTEIVFDDDILIRTKATNTQTKKSRIERYENVSTIFEVTDIEKIKGKHIGIVDDVITTGSTIEACGAVLLEAGASYVSVISLGTVK
jgi:ComF family protein